jgi:hypothetical protein
MTRLGSWPKRSAYTALVVVILGIYSYPALRSAITTGSFRLPPVTAADQGLYLSLSQLHKTPDGAFINPYYRIPVAYPISYLKFRLGPMLFGLLDKLLAGRIWWAMFAWNLLLWYSLCAAAIWLFRGFLPQPKIELVLAGTTLLALFNLEAFGIAFRAWVHHSNSDLLSGLPYIRPFTPQIAIPLLVLYLGLQIRALKQRSAATWGIMALVQFAAFAALPYATLVMAGITAVALLWYIIAGPRIWALRVALGFLIVCSVLDLAFALNRSGGFHSGFPDGTSPIRFQPFLIGEIIGKFWILTALLVLATAFTRKLRPELKWPLVGLGFSVLLFKLSDAVVSERLFYISDHIGYFYNVTITVLVMFLVSAHVPAAVRPLRLVRVAAVAVLVFCVAFASLMAQANYTANLPYNLEQADLSNWFARGQVSANDLILTQFETSRYDNCEWIPLLTDAEVLYCRNAQVILTPDQNRDVQRLREVLYLYFDGKDHQWLESSTQFARTGLYGELESFRTPEELNARIVTLRHEMRPLFDAVERQDPSITTFFRRFRRVWVIQNQHNHRYSNERLASYLNLEDPQVSGSLAITPAQPK